MSIKIPNTDTQWAYSTSSDVSGNVVNCHNITFDKKGYATLNSKMGEVTGHATNLLTVKSVVYNPLTFKTDVITTDKIYTGTPSTASVSPVFSQESTTESNGASNGVYWNGFTLYTASQRLVSWNGTTNTVRNSGLTTSEFHPICIFESANKVAVGDVNIVKLFNTAWVLDTVNQLTIPANYEITWIKNVGENFYIGTKNISNENGRMFVWDGKGTAFKSSYDCGGVWSWSGDVYGSTVVQINSRGQLMEFTGNGFKELASLPVYYTQQMWRDGQGLVVGKIVTDGLKVDGDNIFINLESTIAQGSIEQGNTEYLYMPNQPSGIWCYDPKIGLYPFALMSNDTLQDISISSVDHTTDTFTVSAHSFKTGDKVRYSASISASAGLVTLQMYFIIRLSGTTFKLAYTYDQAVSGTAVNITSNGNTERVMGYLHRDFGVPMVSGAGAIGFYKELQSVTHPIFSKYLLTGSITRNSDFSGSRNSICSLQKNENRGALTTPKISSQALLDNYKYMTVKYNNMLSGNDKIIVKSRTIDRVGMPFVSRNESGTVSATWVNSTSFTIAIPAFANCAIGDEVFFIQGEASGYSAHITNIVESSGTYTVTIDETITTITASNKSHIVVQNWTKEGVISTSHENYVKRMAQFQIAKAQKWIQFKLELRGEGVQIEDMTLERSINQ